MRLTTAAIQNDGAIRAVKINLKSAPSLTNSLGTNAGLLAFIACQYPSADTAPKYRAPKPIMMAFPGGVVSQLIRRAGTVRINTITRLMPVAASLWSE